MESSAYFKFLLEPISDHNPCGAKLDYDNEFIVLLAKLQPQDEVEYGNFVSQAAMLNWNDIEKQTLQLLSKSKDIRLVIILIRSRLRIDCLSALSGGLQILYLLLKNWPDQIHPQLVDEGEYVPIMRANALFEIEDSQGFIADLRNANLDAGNRIQLTIRELENHFISESTADQTFAIKLAELTQRWQKQTPEKIQMILDAFEYFNNIKQLLSQSLGVDRPELSRLETILKRLVQIVSNTSTGIQSAEHTVTLADDSAMKNNPHTAEITTKSANYSDTRMSDTISKTPNTIATHADIRQSLNKIIEWLLINEPGSPVVFLLKYADKSIGKNFIELVDMYPAEILALLKNDPES